MRIDAIGSRGNIYFRGNESTENKTKMNESTIDKVVESQAATLPTKTNQNRKTISIELHNALVKLTAYRMALLFSALSGFAGYQVANTISDNDNEDFANNLQNFGIDTDVMFEIKDINHDGSPDIIIHQNDSSTVILDLKNSNMYLGTKGLKTVK
jgi:hypothetical protein